MSNKEMKLRALLNEERSITLYNLGQILDLGTEEAECLALSFAKENADYTLLYNVYYNDKDGNLIISHATSKQIEELSKQYDRVENKIYAIKRSDDDICAVANTLWKYDNKNVYRYLNELKGDTLYIPSFANISISNIKTRKLKIKAPIEANLPAPGRSAATATKLMNTVPRIPDPKIVRDIPAKEKTCKPPKRAGEQKKAQTSLFPSVFKRKQTKDEHEQPSKVMKTHEKELFDSGGSKFEMNSNITEDKEEEKPNKTEATEKTITYVEKRVKENTYMENGYFVVEENQDYVQVTKSVPITLNQGPKRLFAKNDIEMHNQSSITSFFRRS